MTQETLEPTLEVGDYFGKQDNGFMVKSIDRKNGVYHAMWNGTFWKNTGFRQSTSYWNPDVVIPIGMFEKLNEELIEEGVMNQLPVKMLSDWRKNKNF